MTVNAMSCKARASMCMNFSTLSALSRVFNEHHPLVAEGAGNSGKALVCSSVARSADHEVELGENFDFLQVGLRPPAGSGRVPCVRMGGVFLPGCDLLLGKILKLESICYIEQIFVSKYSTKPSQLSRLG
jgi:hypothetical protein